MTGTKLTLKRQYLKNQAKLDLKLLSVTQKAMVALFSQKNSLPTAMEMVEALAACRAVEFARELVFTCFLILVDRVKG